MARTASSAAVISMRWLVVCGVAARARRVAVRARPRPSRPGPGFPVQAPSVYTIRSRRARHIPSLPREREWSHDLRRLRPPAARHRSRARRRSGSTRSTPSSTASGKTRARFLMRKLLERARELQVGFPATVSTPYVNTIPPEQEPWFPGDEHIERRIRAYIRWNAAVMVVKANKHADGIGGHLSTFASSAALYEVGFNHFFRGKDDGLAGDHVYFQGHAAPGIYARAFLEGRLERGAARQLPPGDRRQRPVVVPAPAADARLLGVPDGVDGPRPDQLDLPGPLQPVPAQPAHRRHVSSRGCGASSATARSDEPETLGSHLARRTRAASTTSSGSSTATCSASTVRCAATARSSRSSKRSFRGAGWNVIKVIWGSKWDELLHRDVDGVLLNKMNTTRRRRVPALRRRRPAPTSASTSSAPTPACARWSSTSPTTTCAGCPAAGTTTASSTPPTRPPPRTRQRRADRDPGQDDQGLDARPRGRGPQRHPPDQEDDQRPAAGAARPALPPRPRSPRRRWPTATSRRTTGRPRTPTSTST